MTISATATVGQVYFNPGETLGEFTERFIAATQGKPPDLIAVVVWHLANRAMMDGAAQATADLHAQARAIADLSFE